MAQVVKLKRSSVAGNVPTTGQMEAGELAMNTADGKLFLRDDSTVRPIVTTDAEITGSLNLVGNAQIGGNLVITGSNSEIILISESAQNSNCKIYNSGDSLILYANTGLGKSVQIGSNLYVQATSNVSEINGFFKFDTPPNDSREQVRIQRRTGATNPGLLVTGSVLIPTAPDIKTTNHIEVGTHITASGNISSSLTGSFAHLKATTIEGNSPLTIRGVSELTFDTPANFDFGGAKNTNLYGNPIFHGDINVYSGSAMLDEIDQVIFRSTNDTIPANGELQLGDGSTPTKLYGNGINLKTDTGNVSIQYAYTTDYANLSLANITASGDISASGELIGTINGGTF